MARRSVVLWWRPGRGVVPRSGRPTRRAATASSATSDRTPPPSGARPSPPAKAPRETVWSALSSYGLVAVLALGVLVASGRPSGPAALPVLGPLSSRQATGWPAWLKSLNVGDATGRDWLEAGLPLLSWASGHIPSPWPVHWRGLAADTIAELTGTPLNNLRQLLGSAVPLATAVAAPARSVRLPAELARVAPNLPGDHSRVWAPLGTRPLVGIYQTHSQEAFVPALSKDAKSAYSTVWTKTVVQVGWWLAKDLHARGIPVVQSRVNNMRRGVLASYNLAFGTSQDILRWWPSVRILLDVHRGDGSNKDTLFLLHGHRTARILLVVGTNQLLPNPHWRENLQFAQALSRALNHLAPGILAGTGVETVPYRYNQQLLPADIQVDIGGPDNSLGDQRRAVKELAAALVQLIHSGEVPGAFFPKTR
jgi:stage II sporulation protein P